MRIFPIVTMSELITIRHVISSNLPCRQGCFPMPNIGAAHYNAANCDWSTYDHHEKNSHVIPIYFSHIIFLYRLCTPIVGPHISWDGGTSTQQSNNVGANPRVRILSGGVSCQTIKAGLLKALTIILSKEYSLENCLSYLEKAY